MSDKCAKAIILCGAALVSILRRKRKRRFFARPINRRRNELGEHCRLFQEIKHDRLQFLVYTRMSVHQFEDLMKLFVPFLTRRRSVQTISAEARLAMTIRFLSQGDGFQSIAWAFRCGKATVTAIVNEVCRLLWRELHTTYLPANTPDQWRQCASEYWSQWNMPNCVGAIDGKHVYIEAPANSGSTFFNYKKNFSIVLMACCDANYKFTRINVGSLGSKNDAGIFSSTTFGSDILNGKVGLPGPAPLPGKEGRENTIPYFVGDEAFPLKTCIMRPYSGRFLEEEKKIFNYRLSRARRTIENAFGILVARWRIFKKTIMGNPDNVDFYVLAAICLHNYLMSGPGKSTYCPTSFVDSETEDGAIIPGDWRKEMSSCTQVHFPRGRKPNCEAIEMRDLLCQFLNSDGAVPWQLNHVRRI